ncbi:hypothetical protein ID866_9300, partial [Astraeus odoratus]
MVIPPFILRRFACNVDHSALLTSRSCRCRILGQKNIYTASYGQPSPCLLLSLTLPHHRSCQLIPPVVNRSMATQSAAPSFYDLKADLPDGKVYDFQQLRGKVVLIVNVASQCGFTPQYKGLQALYDKYKNQDFVILGFPCNQFGNQEPGDDASIASFCELNHGVSFPLMKKSNVNGDNTNDVYKFLKDQKAGILGLTRIK